MINLARWFCFGTKKKNHFHKGCLVVSIQGCLHAHNKSVLSGWMLVVIEKFTLSFLIFKIFLKCCLFLKSQIKIMLKLNHHFRSSQWIYKSLCRTSSTVTNSSYCFRTDENIIKSTKTLQYPNEDLFTFYSKKFLEFGDQVALVRNVPMNF